MTYSFKGIHGREVLERTISQFKDKVVTGDLEVEDKSRLKREINSIDELIEGDGRIRLENQKTAFEILGSLENSLVQTIGLDKSEVSVPGSLRLFEYLQLKTFRDLESGVSEGDGKLPDDFLFLKQALSSYHDLALFLYNSNRPLINYVMGEWEIGHSQFVQEAQEALMHAVVGYDVSKGMKFSPFACWRIEKAFKRAESRQLLSLNAKIRRKDGPRVERLKLVNFKEGKRKSMSGFERVDVEDSVQEMVRFLPKNRWEVIYRKFGFDGGGERTYDDVGDELGMSGARAQRIGEEAIFRLSRTPVAKDFNYLKSMVKTEVVEDCEKRRPRRKHKSVAENVVDFKTWLVKGISLEKELGEVSGLTRNPVIKYRKLAREALEQDEKMDGTSYNQAVRYMGDNRDSGLVYDEVYDLFNQIDDGSGRKGEKLYLEELLDNSSMSFWDVCEVLERASEQPFFMYFDDEPQHGVEWRDAKLQDYLRLQENSKCEYSEMDVRKLLKRVGDVKDGNEEFSGDELVEGFDFCYETAIRVLKKIGVKPPYAVRKTKIGLKTERAIERSFYIPMPVSDLSYFLAIPYMKIYNRFDRFKKEGGNRGEVSRCIVDFSKKGHKMNERGKDQLDYRSASEIYGVYDAGFRAEQIAMSSNGNQISVLSNKSLDVVKHALEYRAEIEPRIISALRIMDLNEDIDRGYRPVKYKRVA